MQEKLDRLVYARVVLSFVGTQNLHCKSKFIARLRNKKARRIPDLIITPCWLFSFFWWSNAAVYCPASF